MRSINVSTSVFARIWASREAGEETEDAILSRLLSGGSEDHSEDDSQGPLSTPGIGGHTERRYGVHFPGGFGIFRVYLGVEYAANAVSGGWVLANDSKTYPSLNELSKGIGAKTENAWVNWFYLQDGKTKTPISAMRDPAKVGKRTPRVIETDKLLEGLK